LSPLPPDHAEMIAENEVKDSLPLYEDSAHPDSDSEAVVTTIKRRRRQCGALGE